jgi:hypothetical protein
MPAPTWYSAAYDIYFNLYKSTGNTTAPFNSYDPAAIVKEILVDFNNNGGTATYTDDTVAETGTVVSYTFNVNTMLEGIKKAIELAPENWYWFLDYGTNQIYYQQKSAEPDHIFSLEKDLIDAKFEKRIEDIVNTVYFTGGDIGGGVNLYKKYENTESVTKYGRKAIKYSDSRVTVTATADTIANSIIENKSEPELRVTLEVMDSNNNQGLGYDIESIQVGDVVAVRNVTQQVGLYSWDIGRWDEAYWDFNIYNLSSLRMQVQRIEYKEDVAIISASTLATDISKRIEDINRNLETLQTLDNPITPS